MRWAAVKAVVNVAHGGDKVGADGRPPAQDFGGVAPDLGDLVEGNVFAILVAVKNGLIKRSCRIPAPACQPA
jgi:hypothetical protein